jgi:hypothetical protein
MPKTLNGDPSMKLEFLSLAILLALGSCNGHQAAAPAYASSSLAPTTIQLPGGEGGIGLDDLRYSPSLGKLLVPGGRTGKLDLVDPVSGAVTSIEGFAAKESYAGGHGDGTTSVDEGAGLLFAIDRTSMQVLVLDPSSQTRVSAAALAAGPDYVRYVAATRELWVTQPAADQIEVFRLPAGARPVPEPAGVIAVAGGPESLVVDGQRGFAYTHLWNGATVAIDLRKRSIEARWPNGCSGSRGIALDEARGWLFVGCAEGRATVIDVHDGKLLSSAPTGAGVDIIDYDPQRGHLYVPGGTAGTLTILGVSAQGVLGVLGTYPVAQGSHCVTTDGNGRVFVGDPEGGRLLVIEDGFPDSKS